MANSKLLAELEARERLDAQSWQRAGKGAAPRTYAYNPKAPRPIRTTATVVDSDWGRQLDVLGQKFTQSKQPDLLSFSQSHSTTATKHGSLNILVVESSGWVNWLEREFTDRKLRAEKSMLDERFWSKVQSTSARRNKLVIGLMKTLQKPTTGFAILGPHQTEAVSRISCYQLVMKIVNIIESARDECDNGDDRISGITNHSACGKTSFDIDIPNPDELTASKYSLKHYVIIRLRAHLSSTCYIEQIFGSLGKRTQFRRGLAPRENGSSSCGKIEEGLFKRDYCEFGRCESRNRQQPNTRSTTSGKKSDRISEKGRLFRKADVTSHPTNQQTRISKGAMRTPTKSEFDGKSVIHEVRFRLVVALPSFTKRHLVIGLLSMTAMPQDGAGVPDSEPDYLVIVRREPRCVEQQINSQCTASHILALSNSLVVIGLGSHVGRCNPARRNVDSLDRRADERDGAIHTKYKIVFREIRSLDIPPKFKGEALDVVNHPGIFFDYEVSMAKVKYRLSKARTCGGTDSCGVRESRQTHALIRQCVAKHVQKQLWKTPFRVCRFQLLLLFAIMLFENKRQWQLHDQLRYMS
ncbi:hypothetical protein CLF_111786 [Clonorchis sinensis]|uniref:Uncharacterized protein n=1 Tax=Clonorchis sinensis TaxID=79923 RepID=G7YLZ8_CLOSI|nr:hypothetical protein CLF_111786 [Clonorchis sinensis]